MMILTLLAPIACKVVDAPDTIEELAVFGLVHFDEGDKWRTAFVDGVDKQQRKHREALVEGLRVDNLTQRTLLESGISDNPDAEEVIGAVASISFASDFDEVVRVVTGDMSKVIDTTDAYDVTTDDDRRCFLSRECDSYAADVYREVGGAWGRATQEVRTEFRWAERSDGTEVFLYRGLAPDPTDTDSVLFRIHQHYQLYAMVDKPAGPLKFEVHWVEAEVIGLDIPDTVALDQVVNGMEDQVEAIDAFIASGGRN